MKRYMVAGRGLNFKCDGTRCITGQVVELREDSHIVGTLLNEGSLVEYKEPKETPAKSYRQYTNKE
jgi:hypothetical protein